MQQTPTRKTTQNSLVGSLVIFGGTIPKRVKGAGWHFQTKETSQGFNNYLEGDPRIEVFIKHVCNQIPTELALWPKFPRRTASLSAIRTPVIAEAILDNPSLNGRFSDREVVKSTSDSTATDGFTATEWARHKSGTFNHFVGRVASRGA